MKTFKLDKWGDIVINKNELEMVEGNDELVQSVWKRLSVNVNEWFLDTEFGLNYSVFMDEKIYDEQLIRSALEFAIMQEPRIAQAVINEITFNKRLREMTIVGYMTDKDEEVIDITGVLRIE